MRAENLNQLHEFLQGSPQRNHFLLAAGVHEVTGTLQIGCDGFQLEGECLGVDVRTILKRGRMPDGSLFTGPLVRGKGISNLALRNLIVDGSRFEDTPRGRIDHRHPQTQDRGSPLFTCALDCPAPRAYFPENCYTPFEADLLFMGCSRLTIQGVSFHNPIKFAIGLGDDTRGAVLSDLHIINAGNGGIWCGLASLSNRPALPLPVSIARQRPQEISIRNCLVENCGASGIYLEAAQVSIDCCTLKGNHGDFPFNHDGGQLEIDYKSENVEVQSCSILGAPSLRRTVMIHDPVSKSWKPQRRILRSVGIEAFGRNLRFFNNRIEGNSHEGMHFNGASGVLIGGPDTQIRGNHTSASAFHELQREPQQNISITTLAAYHALNAVAGDFLIEGIQCENGIMFWSDGSVRDLSIDGIVIRHCDLRGVSGSGIVIGRNASGRSLQGSGWRIEHNI
jgi:hypothetical protein